MFESTPLGVIDHSDNLFLFIKQSRLSRTVIKRVHLTLISALLQASDTFGIKIDVEIQTGFCYSKAYRFRLIF